jgi:response regulator RpfG family c-di-GMP phosphodiesterase
MSGDEMVEIIHNELKHYNHAILIYAITAKYDPESIKYYKEVGITGYLEKPVKNESIYAIKKNRINQL